jgi:hypothetical protein
VKKAGRTAGAAMSGRFPEMIKLDRADLRYAEFLKLVQGWLQERQNSASDLEWIEMRAS